MLTNNQSFFSFSVDNLDKAKEFYGSTLGLNVTETPQGLDVKLSNGNALFIYPKPNHMAASFTVLNFLTDDIDKTVDELTASGISFEKYNTETMKTDEKGIARDPGNGPYIAWFKDPAGNFLSIIQEK